jgi:predicted secreted protein
MAVVNGLSGKVTFDGTGIDSNVKEWSISFAGAELDITAMNATGQWDEYIAGRRSWSGSWTALWDSTSSNGLTPDTSPATGGIGDTAASCEFRFFDDTTNGTIVGNIIITGVDTTVNIDGANEVSYTFRGSGSPTWTKSADS